MATFAVALGATLEAYASGYPERPIRIVVPFAPGGPADVLARLIGQEINSPLGQPLIVDNKAGAAGNIGVSQIAKATPDGYNIGVVPIGNVAVNPALYSSLPYKPSELIPIVMLGSVENVLVVNSAVAARTVKELQALAAAKPTAVSFSSAGAGSQAHLAGELLAQELHVQLTHIPYKGLGPALNDVVSGQVTMMFGPLSAVQPFVKSGKLKAIGVATPQRSKSWPELPTLAEQGLAQFEAVSWYALMAPAGTPKAVIDRLNVEVNKALTQNSVRQRVRSLGFEPGGGTPQELSANIDRESIRWTSLVRQKGLTVD
ncbi:MFS transporter [Comamonas testosteroni]|uniref:MFS transporter n=2 Tax=Comamonas testosteroni TaxID=285 RepID=A0A096F7Z5_COMTE|nr:MFS transporter [Comamonas testosteroni]